MNDKKNNEYSQLPISGLPKHSGKVLLGMMLVSLFLHILSTVRLPGGAQLDKDDAKKNREVKIRIVRKPKAETPDPQNKKILEAQQEKTEAPEEATHLGQVDHKAEKEMRLPNTLRRKKAQDPGKTGVLAKPQPQKPPTKSTQEKTAQQKPVPQPKMKIESSPVKDQQGKLSFGSEKRRQYEALLPSYSDLNHQVAEGYQDYVDDKIEEGDRIDINTKQYRYIGYMTGLRKAIELVWNYPPEASRRGLQGEVGLEFHIQRDGQASRIKVLKSSGYEVLDNAIVEAIRLASPFSPLPPGEKRKRLVITGSFHYVLNSYGTH